jgi:Fic family protein
VAIEKYHDGESNMTTNKKYSYRWSHIRDLSPDERSLAKPELQTLANIWQEHAEQLAASQALKQFNERLARHWAIETGIIEGIYKIDRGITEMLIEKGIESSLIPHGTTDRPAEEVVAVLRDHESVLEGVFEYVASRRSLSTSYIKQVHQALCAHQETVEAQDSQGRFVQVPLRRGEWKKNPNNPHRSDNLIHEYCPPEHVASEMDQLIEMHLKHTKEGISPEIEAAWLHHRFSQIHPFQDGNGRVARALATLVLLRAKLFPFTVDRTERDAYIDCLEQADQGDLAPFIEMVSRSQRRALTKALSLSEGLISEEKDLTALIQSGVQTLKEKKVAQSRDRQEVYQISSNLEDMAFKQMEGVASEVEESLKTVDPRYDCQVLRGDENTAHWFHAQVVEMAKQFEYYADLRRYHRWVRLRIRETQTPSIVVSFHPIGPQFSGVMVASAFYEERQTDTEEAHAVVPLPVCLCADLFEFTYGDDREQTKQRFERWLHDTLVVGLNQWKKSM